MKFFFVGRFDNVEVEVTYLFVLLQLNIFTSKQRYVINEYQT